MTREPVRCAHRDERGGRGAAARPGPHHQRARPPRVFIPRPCEGLLRVRRGAELTKPLQCL